MYIDSHAHLTSDKLFENADALLKRASAAKVHSLINICTDLETLERGLSLAKRCPQVFNAGATTPHDVEKEGEKFFSAFQKAAEKGLLVAIGETGLDYFYEHSKKELQQAFFIRYLNLAKQCDLPIIIHCRDAFDDFFKIIDQHFPFPKKGVLHCFTGTLQEAQKLIERGWYLSLSGIVTFKKSHELKEVAQKIPLEHLLIETDSPYLAPQSQRGKVNEPSFVVEVAHMLAELKNLPLSQIAQKTSQNTQDLFRLK